MTIDELKEQLSTQLVSALDWHFDTDEGDLATWSLAAIEKINAIQDDVDNLKPEVAKHFTAMVSDADVEKVIAKAIQNLSDPAAPMTSTGLLALAVQLRDRQTNAS